MKNERRKTREKKKARSYFQLSLSLCVCACVFILLRKEEFCLSVRIVCVSLDVCFFEAKRGGRKKTREFSCLCVFEFFSFFSPLLLLQKFETQKFSLFFSGCFFKKHPKKKKKKKKRGKKSFKFPVLPSLILYTHI